MSYAAALAIRALNSGKGLSWIYHNPSDKVKPSQPKSKPEKVRCKCGCTKMVRKSGEWGPHKVRTECKKCGKFVKWG